MNSSELMIVNSFDHPAVPAIVGSLAGFEYQLPPMSQLRPVVRLRALVSGQYALPPDTNALDQGLKVPADYTSWYITLRQPDGKYIAKDAPLQQFVQAEDNIANLNRVLWPRYVREWWIDPRQSFVYSTTDGNADAVVLLFQYL